VKTGVLLVNLGTPDTLTPKSIRHYLAEFLSDRRVVNLPRWFWFPLLYGAILPIRPRRLLKSYGSIWRAEGSPLRVITLALVDSVQKRLGLDVPVVCGMTYGRPSLSCALAQLQKEGVRRVVVLPLFPQYSSTTTAAVFDGLARVFARLRDLPELVFIRDYYQNPLYVKAVSGSVNTFWETYGSAQRLLMSFHGIPQRYYRQGDPYPDDCFKTAELLADAMKLRGDVWGVGFQSRFGPEQWVQPYTDDLLRIWANQGVETVDVVCPGFSVDCLETLEEVAVEYVQKFADMGGKRMRYIPALNEHSDHVDLLVALIENNLFC